MRMRLLGAAAAVLLLGLGSARAEGELHIYNWGDHTSPKLIEKFEKTYDVKLGGAQAKLYHFKEVKQDYKFRPVENCYYRTLHPQPEYDDKGDVKELTAKDKELLKYPPALRDKVNVDTKKLSKQEKADLETLKGVYPRLPGYYAEPDVLRNNAMAEVYTKVPTKEAKKKTDDDVVLPSDRQEVVVIVILGILAAFALPRFMNLEQKARIASLSGVEGGLRGFRSFRVARAMFGGQQGADRHQIIAGIKTLADLTDILAGTARIGSNSFAIGGSRTRSGAAIIASDDANNKIAPLRPVI